MVYQEDFAVERWMDEYETKVKLNIAETCCYSLSINEVAEIIGKPFPTEELVKARLVYGAIPGSDQLRGQLADLINETSPGAPIKLTKDDVLVTNGAIGANFLVYYALAAPGDHVVIADPIYQQLQSVPAMFGAKVERLVLRPENGFLPDLNELRAMVKKGQTKFINLNSPHNPTGTVIPQKMMEEIVQIARDADAYLILDEVYRPLYHSVPEGETPCSAATMYEKAVITSSMSKAYGLAGLRLGWVATSNKELLQECLKRRDYNTISVGLVDDLISSWAMSGRHKLLEYNNKLCRENLKIVDEFVTQSEGRVSLVRPQAGTTMFVQVNGSSKTTEEICRLLAEKYDTLAVPGETFGREGFIRIGYANEPEELREGLSRLNQLLKEHSA
uniref:ARAD1D14762p n=1 Tax=Blastobotrys adeninivorans TaxID=409370 RepID=A0A060T9E6_BLAAD